MDVKTPSREANHYKNLEIKLMSVNETIWKAEESFHKLCKDYNALCEHTDKLEPILIELRILFPPLWGW